MFQDKLVIIHHISYTQSYNCYSNPTTCRIEITGLLLEDITRHFFVFDRKCRDSFEAVIHRTALSAHKQWQTMTQEILIICNEALRFTVPMPMHYSHSTLAENERNVGS